MKLIAKKDPVKYSATFRKNAGGKFTNPTKDGKSTYFLADLIHEQAAAAYGVQTRKIVTTIFEDSLTYDAIKADMENGSISADGIASKPMIGAFYDVALPGTYQTPEFTGRDGIKRTGFIDSVSVFIMDGANHIQEAGRAIRRIEKDVTYKKVEASDDLPSQAEIDAQIKAQGTDGP